MPWEVRSYTGPHLEGSRQHRSGGSLPHLKANAFLILVHVSAFEQNRIARRGAPLA